MISMAPSMREHIDAIRFVQAGGKGGFEMTRNDREADGNARACRQGEQTIQRWRASVCVVVPPPKLNRSVAVSPCKRVGDRGGYVEGALPNQAHLDASRSVPRGRAYEILDGSSRSTILRLPRLEARRRRGSRGRVQGGGSSARRAKRPPDVSRPRQRFVPDARSTEFGRCRIEKAETFL